MEQGVPVDPVDPVDRVDPIDLNWVNCVHRFSVAAWSSRPLRPRPLLLLRVNWVNSGQLGPQI